MIFLLCCMLTILLKFLYFFLKIFSTNVLLWNVCVDFSVCEELLEVISVIHGFRDSCFQIYLFVYVFSCTLWTFFVKLCFSSEYIRYSHKCDTFFFLFLVHCLSVYCDFLLEVANLENRNILRPVALATLHKTSP